MTPDNTAPAPGVPGTTMTPQQQRAVTEQQHERLAKAREAASKGVDERLAARDKQNAEYEARSLRAKPTPTQRECDLARVGALDIDNKEDDGSESGSELEQRMLQGQIDNPYRTRELTSDRPGRKK